MYEILPGFLAGLGAILAVNHYFPQQRSSILREFELMEKQLKEEAIYCRGKRQDADGRL